MNLVIKKSILAVLILGSFGALAWTPSGERSKVVQMMQWEPGVNKVAFQSELTWTAIAKVPK